MDDICYYHLRIGYGITLAYYVKKDSWIQYSYAICSSKDQYCKAIGRDIAEERLFNTRQKKVSGFQVKEGEKRYNILRQLVTHFLMSVRINESYVKAPSWLKKIVRFREDCIVDSESDPVRVILKHLLPTKDDAKKVTVMVAI